jgi:hypothetical protein
MLRASPRQCREKMAAGASACDDYAHKVYLKILQKNIRMNVISPSVQAVLATH